MTELDVELQKRADAQKEFDDALNDIMDKTDEEIQEIEEARLKESDGAGELTKDQTTDTGTVDDPIVDPQLTKSDTAPDPTQSAVQGVPEVAALQSEIESLKTKLSKEKQRTSSWDGRIRASNDKVKSLEAKNAELTEQLSTKADKEVNEQDETDQDVMDKFKETFPELVEVVNILEKKIVATTPAKAKEEPETDVKPDTAKPAEAAEESKTASSEHYDTTRSAHPDMDEAVQSGIVLTWINRQPELERRKLEDVYYGNGDNGTSAQVIDMITNFKKATGWKSALALPADTAKQNKLNSMLESEGQSTGAKTDGPDKNDFNGAAKEAFK